MSEIEILIKMLHSVTEYDITSCDYDINGNKCFVIRNLAKNPSMLILGNVEINNFPEWKGKSNN